MQLFFALAFAAEQAKGCYYYVYVFHGVYGFMLRQRMVVYVMDGLFLCKDSMFYLKTGNGRWNLLGKFF